MDGRNTQLKMLVNCCNAVNDSNMHHVVHTAVMGSTVKFLSLVTLIIVITDHDMVLCQNEWKREADGANSSEYIYMY